jgi:YD repeat-containing protein
LRRVHRVRDPLDRLTTFQYCECGTLSQVLNALNQPTDYVHDLQGRLTQTIFPDNTSVTNAYDSLGRLIRVSDAQGSITNLYDNLGRISSVLGPFGQIQAMVYDLEDRVTSSTDANGVTITRTYDPLGRVLSQSAPDGGVERFLHSPRGLVAYTNPTVPSCWTRQLVNSRSSL